MNDQVFVLDNHHNASKAVAHMKKVFNSDVLHEVTVSTFQNKRSIQQNRLYFKWVTVLSDELGYSKRLMHEYLASRFLPEQREEVRGEIISYRMSTKDLKVKPFTKYLNDIEEFATENGYRLPKPSAIYELAMHGTKPTKEKVTRSVIPHLPDCSPAPQYARGRDRAEHIK